MRELFVETRTAVGETGTAHRFDYSIVIGEARLEEGLPCESYGVKVAEQGGETEIIPNITVSAARIDCLMELLMRNTVGPASVSEVVADWL